MTTNPKDRFKKLKDVLTKGDEPDNMKKKSGKKAPAKKSAAKKKK